MVVEETTSTGRVGSKPARHTVPCGTLGGGAPVEERAMTTGRRVRPSHSRERAPLLSILRIVSTAVDISVTSLGCISPSLLGFLSKCVRKASDRLRLAGVALGDRFLEDRDFRV